MKNKVNNFNIEKINKLEKENRDLKSLLEFLFAYCDFLKKYDDCPYIDNLDVDFDVKKQ